jgi:hypothetical protein
MSLLQQYAQLPEEAAQAVQEELPAENTNGLGDLLEIYETVSQEAFTVGDVNNYLQRKSAKISAVVRDNFRALTTWNFQRPEVINVSPLARALNTRNFTDISELAVNVPVGFDGMLVDFATLLTNQSLPLATGVIVDVLLPAQKCFAYYINSPVDTGEVRELVFKPKYSYGDLEAVIKQEATFQIPGNRRSSAALQDVFASKQDITTTADLVNKLNHTLWQQVTPQRVQAETDKLVKLSTTLLGILEGGEVTNTSAVFVKSLMGQLVDVGRFVEWYSTLMTRLGDLTTAMKLNEKLIIELQA